MRKIIFQFPVRAIGYLCYYINPSLLYSLKIFFYISVSYNIYVLACKGMDDEQEMRNVTGERQRDIFMTMII